VAMIASGWREGQTGKHKKLSPQRGARAAADYPLLSRPKAQPMPA
jgi:hypothetical protein